jgi:hypothetical protein
MSTCQQPYNTLLQPTILEYYLFSFKVQLQKWDTYLYLAFLAASYTRTAANPIPDTDTYPRIVCAYPSGGVKFSSNKYVSPEIDDWVATSTANST